MDIDFENIRKQLERINVIMNLESLKPHSQQGGVNEVYTADSNVGKLLIHVGKYSDPEEQVQKGERMFALSEFLKTKPQVPVAEVLLNGTDTKNNHFCIQKFVEGKRLDEVSNKLQYLKHLAEILAHLHQIDVEGAGHLQLIQGKLKGPHDDWLTFLKKEAFKCLDNIYAAKKDQKGSITEKKYLELRGKLERFFAKYQDFFSGVKGKLVHGDILFGNILVNNERINALVDLEWSLSGDPAWEFAGFIDEHGTLAQDYETCLQEYFLCLKNMGVDVDEANFRLRIKLYWVIKLLFIGNTFKKYSHFDWTIQRFDEEINKLL